MAISEPILRTIFVVIYLIVDIVYITLSRPTYENVAKDIQSSGFPALRPLGVILAYGSMVLAWAFLAIPAWEHYRKTMNPYKAAVIVGALYGLLAYGVFNGTNHTIFTAYSETIVARDMLWGMSWAIAITVLYAMAHKRFTTYIV